MVLMVYWQCWRSSSSSPAGTYFISLPAADAAMAAQPAAREETAAAVKRGMSEKGGIIYSPSAMSYERKAKVLASLMDIKPRA